MQDTPTDQANRGATLPAALRAAPVMAHVTDLQGRLLDVNDRWLALLGYEPGEVVGQSVTEICAPQSAERMDGLVDRLTRGGNADGLAVTLRRRDGMPVDVLLSAGLERSPQGDATSLLACMINAGARSDAPSASQLHETWLRAIFENAPIEIVLKDRDLRIMALSKNIASARGAVPSAAIGKRTSDFFPAEIARIYEEADRRVLETGEAIQQDVREVESDVVRHIHNAKFPLRDDSGDIVGICSLTTDMSSARKIEEQLHEVQKMEAVGKLTGGIAHDFNNLLMVISGNLDLLALRYGEEGPEIRAALRAIERGADLTRRLLAFSRRQLLQPQPVVLAELLTEVAEFIGRTLAQGLAVTLELPADLPPVMVDPGQLHNAILNLALNARDAMPRGGRLILKADIVAGDEPPAGEPTEAGHRGYVRLAVADTGSGIAPELLGKVFEPFFTTKPTGEGSGLGLSMVYGFVKQSGGHVTVDSRVGEGTTINLFLPIADQAAIAPASAAHAAANLPRGAGETVLLLDDDPEIRKMAGAMIGGLGYRVTLVADPRAAQAAHEEAGRFDLMVSDILLSADARGTEVAELLCQRQPDLKLIFITGYAGATRGEITLPTGAQVLMKPFSRHGIASALRAALDSSETTSPR